MSLTVVKDIQKKKSAMIKNLEKYTALKFAKGIYLDNQETQNRFGDYGISSKRYSNKWYVLPQGRAIFKTYDKYEEYYDMLKNLRIINELLCYELCKQINLPCARYELATKENISGLISYDVTKQGETLYCFSEYFYKNNIFYENNFKTFVKEIKNLKTKTKLNINQSQAIKDFYKILLFDCLTVQTDRHAGNLFFIENLQKNTLKISPLIDNEFAFNIIYFDMLLINENISQDNIKANLKHATICTTVNPTCLNCVFEENLKDLVTISFKNKEFKEILKNVLSNYNMDLAIRKVEKQGATISPYYKDYLLKMENIVKTLIKENITKLKNEQANTNTY